MPDVDLKDEQRRRLEATISWARKIRASLQGLLNSHGERVHFRPSSTGVAMFGLRHDRPQRGKSGITNLDRLTSEFETMFATHCRDIGQGRVAGIPGWTTSLRPMRVAVAWRWLLLVRGFSFFPLLHAVGSRAFLRAYGVRATGNVA